MLKKLISKKQKKVIITIGLSLVLLCISIFTFHYVNKTVSNGKDYINNVTRTDNDFINEVKYKAISLNKKYKVPASIIIAQASLESNFGKSDLASKYGNLFGIKAGPFEQKVKLPTKEFVNNRWIVKKEYFKVYDSWDKSLEDHTKLITQGTSWNKNQYENVIKANNYKEAARALQEAGYATDPNYAEKLITIIDNYQLYRYDTYK